MNVTTCNLNDSYSTYTKFNQNYKWHPQADAILHFAFDLSLQALKALITLPTTTCRLELSFSTWRLVKTWQKFTTRDSRLSTLCMLSVHHELVIRYKSIVDNLTSHSRRLQFVVALSCTRRSHLLSLRIPGLTETVFFSLLILKLKITSCPQGCFRLPVH